MKIFILFILVVALLLAGCTQGPTSDKTGETMEKTNTGTDKVPVAETGPSIGEGDDSINSSDLEELDLPASDSDLENAISDLG